VLSTFDERDRKKIYDDMLKKKYVIDPDQPHGVQWGSIRRVVRETIEHTEGRGPPPRPWGFHKQGRRRKMESKRFNKVADDMKSVRPATFGTAKYQQIITQGSSVPVSEPANCY
jgi:hypothetical protein